jgi:flagellar hook-length control protein FliK
MTIEMAQTHTASKTGSASKAADSRFKSAHGKSPSDAGGGFQSILSAAADASSEISASSTSSSAQVVNDPVAKDLKDLKNRKEPQDVKTPIGQGADAELSQLSILTQVLPDPIDGAPSIQADNPSTMASMPMQAPLAAQAQPPSAQTRASSPSVSETVSALLAQARFVSPSPSSSSSPQSPLAEQIQAPDAEPIALPATPVLAAQQPATAAQVLNNPSQPQPSTPQVSATPLAAIASSPAATFPPQLPPQIPERLATILAKPAASAPEIAVPLVAARSAATFGSLPVSARSMQDAAPALAALAPSVKATASSSDNAAKPAAKTAATAVTDAASSFAPMYALQAQLPLMQPPPSTVSNQEIKASEALKTATNPVSAAPIARLAGLDTQERQSKAAGLNEFKPWSAASFSASSRMSDASSNSSAAKESSVSAIAGMMAANNAMPQPVAAEAKFTPWLESSQINSVATEIPLTTLETSAREVLREEHAIFKSNQSDPLPDLQSFQLSGVEATTSVVTPEGAVPLETYVAEQVTYWINQDIQNAELKLEGIGIDPVQVNITMQGNEAFVTFTTDEIQAREALENASEQLKDMMLSQGVVLSGVSIGSSGAGDSGAQARNPRQGNKQSMVASVQTPMEENRPKAGRITGSTLDLFV